ncbi:MAG TPA: MATE family efflux transporter, partial [Thermodesulfobacteriota bacterium]|nr:MATE family efflux transporter [Thermodesulfobacteriota bacterium]
IGQNLINTIWVGHLVGENAVGATGVSFPVLFILISFSIGMSMATTILVSQYYGAKDFLGLNKVINNSFSLAMILSLGLSFVAVWLADPLLRLMQTPAENFSMASGYLKVVLGGFPLYFLAFIMIAVLRGLGDTLTPLFFMAVAIGLNTVLDPFFIGGFGPFPLNGLKGAAWATVLSQGVGLATGIIFLNRKKHPGAVHPGKLLLDKGMTALLFKIGGPSIVQQILISTGTLFMTALVNTFGAAATNAFGAVTRIEMIAIMPAVSISTAVAALTGQNMGADKPHQIRSVFRWGLVVITSMTLLISLMAVFLSGPILTLFGLGNDRQVMQIGTGYLQIVGAGYVVFTLGFISNGVINGAGRTLMTMTFSLLSLWVFRIPMAWSLSRTGLGITGLWVGIVLSFFGFSLMSLGYYLSGRWQKKGLAINPDRSG